jgi:hypothetical protein
MGECHGDFRKGTGAFLLAAGAAGAGCWLAAGWLLAGSCAPGKLEPGLKMPDNSRDYQTSFFVCTLNAFSSCRKESIFVNPSVDQGPLKKSYIRNLFHIL